MNKFILIVAILFLLNFVTAKTERRQLYYLIDHDLENKPSQLTDLQKNQYEIPIFVINWY